MKKLSAAAIPGARWGVDRMIRRSVRQRFHSVCWLPPSAELSRPTILVANHHGWHDGYLMYLATQSLGLPVVDWIEEFDAFPLFAAVGGMPFPADDPIRRAVTVRGTIRAMNTEGVSLLLFAEGKLHRPGGLLPFGKSLEMVARTVPGATVVPVAIAYELSMHERPEAFVTFGEAVPAGEHLANRTRLQVAALLDRLKARVLLEPETFQVLCAGTKDVNERFDMRRIPNSRRARGGPRT